MRKVIKGSWVIAAVVAGVLSGGSPRRIRSTGLLADGGESAPSGQSSHWPTASPAQAAEFAWPTASRSCAEFALTDGESAQAAAVIALADGESGNAEAAASSRWPKVAVERPKRPVIALADGESATPSGR